MDAGSQALSDYLFASKYAKHLGDRRETYPEAVRRVMGMHREKYAEKLDTIAQWITDAEYALLQKEVLGSQRNMQYGGLPVMLKNERSYNCCASYCDRPEFFKQAFFLLLMGCGVGFSVQRHHVDRLPDVSRPIDESTRHVVADTCEGWADALDALLDSYFGGGRTVRFDYSLVRPEGSILSSGVGFAPGPKPLRDALEAIRALLEECVDRGARLRPIDCYDIVMHASCAVLSGGVRRSATICIFSVDDDEMATAKTRENFDVARGLNPQRGRSNNSAVLLRNSTSRATFQRFMDIARHGGGEPGFYWVDSLDIVPNPCLEVGFYPVWEGRSCWHFCNLSTINGAKCKTRADFLIACRNAAVLGTLQAGYTNFPYLGPDTEALVRHEALIGVSIAGVKDSPELLLDGEVLEAGVAVIEYANVVVSDALRIRPAARLTVEKPDGTSAPFLGAASGIHDRHAHMTIRRVQANRNELPAKAFAEANPHAVEALVWREGDIVLKFPLLAPEGARLRRDSTAVQQLRDVATFKKHWIDAGRVAARCNHPAVENSVSNTVTVQEGEWDAVADFIYENRTSYAGVSLLSASGDLDYPQAPLVSCDEPERAVLKDEWCDLANRLQPVDYSASVLVSRQGDVACAGGACEI